MTALGIWIAALGTLAIVTSLLQTSDRFTRLQMNRAPALSRAEREHRKLLRLCREGKVPEACKYLVAHIDKVRQDLHALLRRDARTVRYPDGDDA